jgi:hypothetical protein
MDDPQAQPTGQMWLQDFRAILALPKVTEDAVRSLIYERYPDSGWANEYRFSIWNAYCYLLKEQAAFEDHHLVVLDEKRAILKDELLAALYHPFLTCPLERMHLLDFPPDEIAADAHRIGNRRG